jgi:hypothetical protein
LKQYRYYKCGKTSLPAGDIETIVCEQVRKFLDSDMIAMPEEKRLALKQVQFSETMLKDMVEKIVCHDHKLKIWIKVADSDYLKNHIQTNYINTTTEPIPNCYLTDDGAHAVIEKDIWISSRTCINRLHEGGEVNALTKTENATMLIKGLAYGWKYKKMFETGSSVKEIGEQEKRSMRTIYKYLNLAYLSPRIIGSVMESEIPAEINLQQLIEIASQHDDFTAQERAFYGC